MTEHALVGLAAIVVLGVAAQWLAWKLRLPSIILLLAFGYAAGPLTGLIEPERLLGDLLSPVISLSVALILFDGALNLKMSELRGSGRVVGALVTLGAAVTWAGTALAARFLLDLPTSLAVLLGAILVVTGPTVVLPLLRHVRPTGVIGSVVKWEGIVIDPVGAALAVLVFEAIRAGGTGEATLQAVGGLARTALVGGFAGVGGALAVVLVLKRFWVPDFLHNPVTLMVVFMSFVAANHAQPESGLLAVTVMGIVLVNQRWVAVRHIVEFKENLGLLAVSSLFIVLAAGLEPARLWPIQTGFLLFLGVLVLVVRPAAVAVSTIGSTLSWRERLFVAWMAPRGIVAAAVASVFSLRLAEAGYAGAGQLVPITFLVIIGTVVVYGLTSGALARGLGVAYPNPQGSLVVGANPVARLVATALMEEGFDVLLVDTNRANVSAARRSGLRAHAWNVLSESFREEVELEGIGRILAMTPNSEVNSLALLQCAESFDASVRFQLCECQDETGVGEVVPSHLRGRILFGEGVSYDRLRSLVAAGAVVKRTGITGQFGIEEYRRMYGDRALPLLLVKGSGIEMFALDSRPEAEPGDTLVSLVSGD